MVTEQEDGMINQDGWVAGAGHNAGQSGRKMGVGV
jgi:hypothetical protein